MVPFIGMSLQDAKPVADTFEGFLPFTNDCAAAQPKYLPLEFGIAYSPGQPLATAIKSSPTAPVARVREISGPAQGAVSW